MLELSVLGWNASQDNAICSIVSYSYNHLNFQSDIEVSEKDIERNIKENPEIEEKKPVSPSGLRRRPV